MELKGLNICVTGGAGFLGSHLVEALCGGNRVSVVDNFFGGFPENLLNARERIEVLKLDISSPEFAETLAQRGFDVIYHLAGNGYVPPSVKDPMWDFNINLLNTMNVLEALRQNGLKSRLVFASTAAVYGVPTRLPISEIDPQSPISPYGAGKLAAEKYVDVYARIYGLETLSLRFFSMYGPRLRRAIVFDFIEKLTKNPDRIEIIGDGTQVRDLLFVQDAIRAILCATENAAFKGEVYNVASGHSYTTLDLAKTLIKVLNLDPGIEFTGALRDGDSDRWEADITKLSALGYKSETDLEQGLRKTIDWYKTLKSSNI